MTASQKLKEIVMKRQKVNGILHNSAGCVTFFELIISNKMSLIIISLKFSQNCFEFLHIKIWINFAIKQPEQMIVNERQESIARSGKEQADIDK